MFPERSSRRLLRQLSLAYRSNYYFKQDTWLGWVEIFTRLLLVPAAALGLLIYVSFFVFETYFRPPAIITISILDAKEDVNFPGMDPNNSGYYNNTIVWKVDRFMYFSKFPKKSEDIIGRFEKLPSGKNLDLNGWGFWMYKNSPSVSSSTPSNISPSEFERGDEQEYVYTDLSDSTASIRAMRIMEQFTSVGIPPEELEVSIGFRAYVDGEAMIVIRFQDGITHQIEGRRLSRQVFGNKGFCYKILEDIPFDKRIDMIQILPISTTFKRHGIVIVDEVVIVVANRGVTESIMHTLIPSGWC